MSKKAKNPVKTAKTALEIVEALKKLEGSGVTQLADYLELPKSTVHNHLSTLEQEEFVIKDGQEYRIGIRFFDIGAYARAKKDLYHIAKPEVNKLATKTGEMANLAIEEHGRAVFLHRSTGNEAIEVDTRVGTRVYLHNTALGKTILSQLPEDRVEEIVDHQGLPQSTDNTISSLEELKNELETVRANGYAVDDEERIPGLRCIATPVSDEDGGVLGAISIVGPVNRIQGDRFRKKLPEQIMEAANVIEINIAYS